uniref:Uncharacterized protein n=1 Tax=Oryza meridionalis TaxID=40149 RepID=A0A0E0CXI3_9ORYZ
MFLPFSSPHRRHREPPRPPERGAVADERGLSTDQNSFEFNHIPRVVLSAEPSFTKDISNPEGLLWGVLHRASTVKAGQEDNQGAHNSSSSTSLYLL